MSAFEDADFSWMKEAAPSRIMYHLNRTGTSRYVGGCVRDSLLGFPPGHQGRTDIDIATTLLPEDVMEVLSEADIRHIPTGIEHGTITAVIDRIPYEITTLRADVATDGRRAVVAFTEDWEEDAGRRDFTINALYLSKDGTIHDYHGGQDDLTEGRVRFIGDAEARIREDYLRILRFLRFSTRFARDLDEDGWAACVKLKDGIDHLSRERIWNEISRLFHAKRSPLALRKAAKASVLSHICPSRADPEIYDRLHEAIGHPMSSAEGLASLWPEAARETFQTAFKPANATLDEVDILRRTVKDVIEEIPPQFLLYRHGREMSEKGCHLAGAMQARPVDKDYFHEVMTLPVPHFPLKGADFVAHGVPKGPKVGAAQQYFEKAWIAAGFPDDQETIDHLMAAAARSV
ncbi:CCA tRNA nucleotidyltransferase [Parvularcula marina]|nr:CCA tRNA nucleotidyltransferase [Parvularcula marina]